MKRILLISVFVLCCTFTRAQQDILVADRTVDDVARILAGLPVEEDSPVAYWMEKDDWKEHRVQLDSMWESCAATLAQVKELADNDFADINGRITDVLYPFSGPDIAYAASFFPGASAYWLFAMEKTGSVPDLDRFSQKAFDRYRYALLWHLANSYFITKRMESDLNNSSVDGTIPILLGFLARMGYRIAGVGYRTLKSDGTLAASKRPSDAVEISFFNEEEKALKTVSFVSCNIKDGDIRGGVIKLISRLSPESTAGYTKSCSYCMHRRHFSRIRNLMLDHCFAIIQDDTGIRYNQYDHKAWELSYYGGYVRPLACFSEWTYQKELDTLYNNGNHVILPLGFRHGYNQPSSLIVARKK